MTHTKDEAQPATEESSATQPAQPTVQEPVAWIDSVMEQAQIFASSWSLVGGQFDSGNGLEDAEQAKAELRAMLTTPPAPPSPEGTVLLPKRMTQAMRDVTDTEDWTWEDLLAAAEAITEGEYNELAAPPAAQKAIEFGMNGEKMMFKVGVQQFTLDYEPDTQDEFNFMRDMLVHAFSTFTPDVKTTPPAAQPAPVQPADPVQPVDFEAIINDIEAIDCRYRGDPSYDRDAYWMRDEVVATVKRHASFCTPPAAQPAVPDAITDSGENPEYRAGWNECRETMLQILKARTL
jgi:hypothetical protein